jgi:hypothetical protein
MVMRDNTAATPKSAEPIYAAPSPCNGGLLQQPHPAAQVPGVSRAVQQLAVVTRHGRTGAQVPGPLKFQV